MSTTPINLETGEDLLWGSYGKGGAEHCGGCCPEHRLRMKKLSECDTDHLQAILRTQQQVHYFRFRHYVEAIHEILKTRGVEPEKFNTDAAWDFSNRMYDAGIKYRRSQ